MPTLSSIATSALATHYEGYVSATSGGQFPLTSGLSREEAWWQTTLNWLAQGADPQVRVTGSEGRTLPLPLAVLSHGGRIPSDAMQAMVDAGLSGLHQSMVLEASLASGAYAAAAVLFDRGVGCLSPPPVAWLEKLIERASATHALEAFRGWMARPDGPALAQALEAHWRTLDTTPWHRLDAAEPWMERTDRAACFDVWRSSGERDRRGPVQHFEVFLDLLRQHFDWGTANDPNAQGSGPIMAALDRGNEDVVCALLAHGACPDRLAHHRDTEPPVVYAAQRNLAQALISLVEHGADLTVQDANGYTTADRLASLQSSEAPMLRALVGLHSTLVETAPAPGRRPRL